MRYPGGTLPRLALLGGGTMNVTARWCGMRGEPGDNFRAVMRSYMADRLLWREVPLLAVRQGEDECYGFTFGAGPLVRILERYESGTKGHLGAIALGVKSITAALTNFPRSYRSVLREMEARILVDGQELPYGRYTAVFANVTGAINPFIEPFLNERTRDSFHFLAYAASTREFAMLAPLLARARPPIDPKALLRPISTWKQVGLSLAGKGELPLDPRYINHPARHLTIYTAERHFTIDGELLPITAPSLEVRLGPALHLALVS
jgi:diacylglycerol kinase family enzyme